MAIHERDEPWDAVADQQRDGAQKHNHQARLMNGSPDTAVNRGAASQLRCADQRNDQAGSQDSNADADG